MLLRYLYPGGFLFISLNILADPHHIRPPASVIEQYVIVNDRLYDEKVDLSQLQYGLQDINGDGVKDWYLHMPPEPYQACRTEVFINKNDNYCYAGSEWKHTLQYVSPALRCDKEYIFTQLEPELTRFTFGASYLTGNDAMVIRKPNAKQFKRGGHERIGFSLYYKTGRKDSVFSFKLIMPSAEGSSRMPGYKVTKAVQADGSAIFTHSKKLKLGRKNINAHIRPEKSDPPGPWKIEFYFDDKLIEQREFYVE